MTVYAIAQLTFTDRPAYDRYQARFMSVFSKFAGLLLAADENPIVLEGEWPREKLVLMSFPERAAFDNWANSADYQEILKDRKQGAEAVVLLVKGLR